MTMNIKLHLGVIYFLSFIVFPMPIWSGEYSKNTEQYNVIELIKQADSYINDHGKEKAILKFREKSNRIFAINFNGKVLASPIHPETVGTNQINLKDPSGVFVVQEEIEKAKAGGGWLKGRFRKNPQTDQYACRKLYIHPMPGNYFIGSWYYYPATIKDSCEL